MSLPLSSEIAASSHLTEGNVPSGTFSMVLSHQDLTIVRVSSSTEQIIAYTRQELVGHPLITLIGKSQVEILELQLSPNTEARSLQPISCTVCARYSSDGDQKDLTLEDRVFDMTVRASDGSLIAEFSPSEIESLETVPIPIKSVTASMKKIQAACSIEELLSISAQEMRKMIPVDRVMIYEFKKDDGHIKVVAEDKRPEYPSFVGHHYPSTHMSEHARLMTRSKDLSIFSDVVNQPLLSPNSVATLPRNLTLAAMRYMSPAHVELLDMMNVRFSMSVSIIVDEQLWGLIVFHDHVTQAVSHSTRVSCELLGHVISSKFTSLIISIQKQRIRDYRLHMVDVLDSLIGVDDWKKVVLREAPKLYQLFGATGVVILFNSCYTSTGLTPDLKHMKLLRPYIESQQKEGVFACSSLISNHAPGKAYKDIGSGILAISLIGSIPPDDMIVLFRKEKPQLVKWVNQIEDSTLIEGCSETWTTADLEIAHELKRYLLEIKHRYQKRQIEEQESLALLAKHQETKDRALTAEREATQRATIAEDHRRQQVLFIDTMCHEIRNPINGITGTVSLLHDHLAIMEDKIHNSDYQQLKDSLVKSLKIIRDGLNDIDECASHQRIIADDVLSLSKLQENRVRLEQIPMNLTAVLHNILRTYESIVSRKNIKLEIQTFDTDLYILGDRNRLKQIICNLMDNAVKFTSRGFIRIRARLLHLTQDNLQTFEIGVEDSGLGMTKNESDRLFVAYSQANQGISGQYGGTGLGLVISQELARLMQGQITIRSEKGVGSEFKLDFAAQVITSDEYLRLSAPQVVTTRIPSSGSPHTKRILVVEDNVINQKVLNKIIDKAGHKCDIANNGLEAVELYRLYRHCIIFMDIQMPVMGGLEATRLIREIELEQSLSASYIACISGNAREEHRQQATESGVNTYLVKPFNRDEVMNIINGI